MKQLDRDLMFYVILLHQTGFTWSTPNPLTGQISYSESQRFLTGPECQQ